MFLDGKMKKGTGAVYFVAVLFLVGLFGFVGWASWREAQQDYINAHTSTHAVVVDKYTKEIRGGAYFYLTTEHEAVNKDGEKIVVTNDFSVPYGNYEVWVQIEVGDLVETYYIRGIGWRLAAVEIKQEK